MVILIVSKIEVAFWNPSFQMHLNRISQSSRHHLRRRQRPHWPQSYPICCHWRPVPLSHPPSCHRSPPRSASWCLAFSRLKLRLCLYSQPSLTWGSSCASSEKRQTCWRSCSGRSCSQIWRSLCLPCSWPSHPPRHLTCSVYCFGSKRRVAVKVSAALYFDWRRYELCRSQVGGASRWHYEMDLRYLWLYWLYQKSHPWRIYSERGRSQPTIRLIHLRQ